MSKRLEEKRIMYQRRLMQPTSAKHTSGLQDFIDAAFFGQCLTQSGAVAAWWLRGSSWESHGMFCEAQQVLSHTGNSTPLPLTSPRSKNLQTENFISNKSSVPAHFNISNNFDVSLNCFTTNTPCNLTSRSSSHSTFLLHPSPVSSERPSVQ